MAIASLIVMSGGTIFQPIFGWALNHSWNGIVINHLAIYSSQNFFNAMLVIPVAFIVGAAITRFLKN
jgi:multisubunit Na+/H+ antiporter MnhB subunit